MIYNDLDSLKKYFPTLLLTLEIYTLTLYLFLLFFRYFLAVSQDVPLVEI